jgi:cleavage and polyadenylation specificity factor subunit 5
MSSSVALYNLEEYTFGIGAQVKQHHSTDSSARSERRRQRFVREGMRRSVRGVLLVHAKEHPHVLLLQRKEDGALRLPGGVLRPGEEDQAGLSRKLCAQLASASIDQPQWDVGTFLGQLWRPTFDALDDDRNLYPYVAPHVSKPRENVKVFLVALPPKCVFAVPPAYQLLAIPLFELHNAQDSAFPPDVLALPLWLSRCEFMAM